MSTKRSTLLLDSKRCNNTYSSKIQAVTNDLINRVNFFFFYCNNFKKFNLFKNLVITYKK